MPAFLSEEAMSAASEEELAQRRRKWREGGREGSKRGEEGP